MPGTYALAMEPLLEVCAELQAVISLHHSKLKTELRLGAQHCLQCQTRRYPVRYYGIGKPAVDINDGIQVCPLIAARIN